MALDPIATAKKVEESYRRYVETTFRISDPEYQELFLEELRQRRLSKGPYVEAVGSFKTARSVARLIDDGVLSPEFRSLFRNQPELLDRDLYVHQERAIAKAVDGENLVVSTGTGSGKTETFLYPILHHLFEQERVAGELQPGVRALLLYPMNALANDQMKRLRRLLGEFPSITFGSYTGETEWTRGDALPKHRKIHGSDPPENEFISRETIQRTPPHILVTNYAMLEYLLLRPADSPLFRGVYADQWRFIVLDEAHTYRGATGMEVSLLLRRLVHTLADPNKVQYILTSATLGNESDDLAIREFASALCDGRQFGENSVIRASRVTELPLPEIGNGFQGGWRELFDRFSATVNGNESEPTDESLAEELGSQLASDPDLKTLRAELQSSIEIPELAERIGLGAKDVVALIQLAGFAKYRGEHLIDARFHHFIRTLEGAYVTFGPRKTLSIEPVRSRRLGDRSVPVYEIAVCQYCGAVYVDGYENKGKFEQRKGVGDHYLVLSVQELDGSIDDQNAPDDIHKRVYGLCAQCGSFVRGTNSPGCKCGEQHHVFLLKAVANDKTGLLHTCAHCRTSNPNGSVLRGFYVGQHAAAAVVGSALYEEMPSRRLTFETLVPAMGQTYYRTEVRKTKQLLIFSDSRQDAAFFAPYFERTYQNLMRRRLILQSAIEICNSNETYRQSGAPLPALAKAISSRFENQLDIAPEEATKEAWKSLFYEIQTGDRHGLKNLGLMDFLVPSEMTTGYDPFPEAADLRSVDQLLLDSFLKHSAIADPEGVQFTQDDRRFYAFHGNRVSAEKGPKPPGTKRHMVWWVAETDNDRMDLLRKTGRFENQEQIQRFLSEHFDVHTAAGNKTTVPAESGYQVDPARIRVIVDSVHSMQWYRCDVCGRTTPRHIEYVCPHYHCSGQVHPIPMDDEFSYFRHQIETPEVYPMKVKEHTAQLSPKTAAEYQQQFVSGEINVLSSSTTFEMGVDVGELETVFMRNVPPSPANYVQRAGRAGRRTDSTAYALTFCRLTNHDLSYFREPERMLDGTIAPPVFKLGNEKIVRRHVYATLLSAYWRQQPDLKEIGQLFGPETFKDLIGFASNIGRQVMNFVRDFVPREISDEEIKEMVEQYASRLSDAMGRYSAEKASISELIDEILDEVRNDDARARLLSPLIRQRKALESERIINHFSRANLIPKYGFPVDTVELKTDLSNLTVFRNRNARLRLQRDLIQAITDYAPGSEVIADGYRYTSSYIQPPWRQDQRWKQYQYGRCSNENCSTFNFRPFYGEDLPTPMHDTCVACGSPVTLSDVFLVPEQGFVVSAGDPPKANGRPPQKTGRTAIHYMGNMMKSMADPRPFHFGLHSVEISTSANDELVVMNRSPFYVCHTCGFGEPVSGGYGPPIKTKAHKTPRARDCNNQRLIRKSLGHAFRTDVTLLKFDQYRQMDEALSIMYSILEATSRHFGIERNDIDGTVSYLFPTEGTPKTILVLFDTVPGGAGHVKRVAEMDQEGVSRLFRTALDVVESCTCGDNGDGNAACYSCLCNYRNQIHHDVLRRRYAIDFFYEMNIDPAAPGRAFR